MRCLLAALGVSVVLALQGCGSLQAGPELPVVNLTALDTATDWITVRKAYTGAYANEAERIRIRNDYISNATAAIDVRFLAYLRSLSVSRNTMQAASQESILALGVAGTVVSSAAAKTNIASAIALISGSQAIVDSVYFANQTTDAIAAQMVAARREAFIDVLEAMQAPASVTDLDAARNAVLAYQDAGSFKKAIAQVHQDASVRAANATLLIQGMTVVRNVPENLTKANDDLKRSLTKKLAGWSSFSPDRVREVLVDLGVSSKGVPVALFDRVKLLQLLISRANTDGRVVEIKNAMTRHNLFP